MARVEIDETVQKAGGSGLLPAAGASVYVYLRGTTTAATVYAADTGGATSPQPLTTDAFGRINGWVDEGSYDLAVQASPGVSPYTQAYEAVAGSTIVGLSTSGLPIVPLKSYTNADGATENATGIAAAIAAFPSGAVFMGQLGGQYLISTTLNPLSNQTFNFYGCTLRMKGVTGRTSDRMFDINNKSNVHIRGGDWLAALTDGTTGRTDARVLIEGASSVNCSFEPDRIDASDLTGPKSARTVWVSNGARHFVSGEHKNGQILIDGGTDCRFNISHTGGASSTGTTNSITMRDFDANRMVRPVFERLTISDYDRMGLEMVAGGTATNQVDAEFNNVHIFAPRSTGTTAISPVMPGSRIRGFLIENPKGLGIEGSGIGTQAINGVIRWDTAAVANGTGIGYNTGAVTGRGGMTVSNVWIINPGTGVWPNTSGAFVIPGKLTCHQVTVVNPAVYGFRLTPNNGTFEASPHLSGCHVRFTSAPISLQNRVAYGVTTGAVLEACSADYEASSASVASESDIFLELTGSQNDVTLENLSVRSPRTDANLLVTFNPSGTHTGWLVKPNIRITGGMTATPNWASVTFLGEGAAAWTPTAALANGAISTTTVAVTGAKLGDPFTASFSNAVPVGCLLVAAVTVAGTVGVTLLNQSGAAQTLGAGTVRVARTGSV